MCDECGQPTWRCQLHHDRLKRTAACIRAERDEPVVMPMLERQPTISYQEAAHWTMLRRAARNRPQPTTTTITEVIAMNEILALLTLDQIEAWATKRAPTAVVGVNQSGQNCPLYHYLTERGAPIAMVGTRYVRELGDPITFDRNIPTEIVHFLTVIDRHPARSPITASQVLQAITEVRA